MKIRKQETPPLPIQLEYAPPMVRAEAALDAMRETLPQRYLPLPDRLDDIASALRSMPYAEFIEFAQAVGAEPHRVWQWAAGRKVRIL